MWLRLLPSLPLVAETLRYRWPQRFAVPAPIVAQLSPAGKRRHCQAQPSDRSLRYAPVQRSVSQFAFVLLRRAPEPVPAIAEPPPFFELKLSSVVQLAPVVTDAPIGPPDQQAGLCLVLALVVQGCWQQGW